MSNDSTVEAKIGNPLILHGVDPQTSLPFNRCFEPYEQALMQRPVNSLPQVITQINPILVNVHLHYFPQL
jgi:hypothetical protein